MPDITWRTSKGTELQTERRAAFQGLYQRCAGKVFGYALRRSSEQEAQDVVAETFLVAWRRMEQIPDDELPWLLGVARRVLANRRRAAVRGSNLETKLRTVGQSRGGGDPADEVEARESVRAALDRLPPLEREAVTLIAWEGLDSAQAARVAGCSQATFAVRLHRARRRLIKELNDQDVVEPAEGAHGEGYEEAELR